MDLKDIVVVPKLSKYEHDLFKLMITHDELMDLYEREGIDPTSILESHKRQKAIQKKFEEHFPGKVIFRNFFTKEIARKADLVIALGGDNHFTFLSHFLDTTPILGINADPQSSEGVLLSANSQDFKEMLEKLEADQYTIEEWTRLDTRINGRKLQPAASEVYIGNKQRTQMSHYRIRHNGTEELQKGSGLIITTGAGSTGWYRGASRYLFPDGNAFPATEKKAHYITSEPYMGKLSGTKLLHDTLKEGETLEVTSLHREGGIVAVDCLGIHDFGRDKKVTIKLSKTPLRVMRLTT